MFGFIIGLLLFIHSVTSSVWLQGKDKSNEKTSEKFNNCINKQETKGLNNCTVNMKVCVKLKRKMLVVVSIRMGWF